MSEKQELIKQMLDMQKKFIRHEHKQGVMPGEYFTDFPDDPVLKNYREEYLQIADKVVNLAHQQVGSKRD